MQLSVERVQEDSLAFALRWTARVLGGLSIAVLMLFLLGDKGSLTSISPREILGVLFFPFGLILGLVLGWWKELLGGVIAVGSVAGFYLIYEFLINGSWPRGPWFFVFTAPGLLFLSYGILSVVRNPRSAVRMKV